MLQTVIGFAVGFVISALGTRGATAMGLRFGIVDKPASDKAHTRTVPRVGGLGIALGFLIAAISVLTWTRGLDPRMLGLLYGAMAVAAVGLLDDILTLRPLVKLMGVSAAAAVPFVLGAGPSGAAGIAAWVFVVFLANAMNLLDGQDGLAGCVSLIAASAMSGLFWMFGMKSLAVGSFALAGAIGGFLLHNLPPARIFMGDTGSLLLGYVLAWQGVILSGQSLGGAVAALVILIIPIADTLFVTLRRAYRRQKITAGGLDHTYNLLARRIGQRAVLWYYCGVASLAGTLALICSRI